MMFILFYTYLCVTLLVCNVEFIYILKATFCIKFLDYRENRETLALIFLVLKVVYFSAYAIVRLQT